MDKRKNNYLRLLKTIVNTFAIGFLLSMTGFAAELYVRVKTSDCSKTKLSIKIEQLKNLPESIDFSITDSKTGVVVITPTRLPLQNDEYVWTGLISFKDYTAVASVPGIKVPLQDKFTNKILLLQFLDKATRIVQVRNSDKEKAPDETVKSVTRVEDITLEKFSSNVEKIHLLLIGTDNKLTEQYLGSPIPVWSPSIPDGIYKLVIVEYDKNDSKCGIKSKQA